MCGGSSLDYAGCEAVAAVIRHGISASIRLMGQSVGDPGENILEVGLPVQTVELCRDDKRIEGCRPLAATIRSCEQVVMSAQRNHSASRSRRCCCVCLENAPARDVARTTTH
jgi:hypothetical protein